MSYHRGMRLTKSHLVLVIALMTALVVTSATTGSAGHPTKLRPTVSVSGSGPVTVFGFGFLPRERVMVRLFAGGGVSRVATASLRGRIVVRFASVTLPDCVSVVVVATGLRSRASARGRTIPPPCGPAPQD